MVVVSGAVCPHPPIAVPEVGRGEDKKIRATQEAMLEIGRRIKESGAGTLVIISPHIPVIRDAVLLNGGSTLSGDLSQFGAPQVSFELEPDHELAQEIRAHADKAGLETFIAGRRRGEGLELDHGVVVPLYFLRRAGVDLPLLTVSINFWELEKLYLFGRIIAQAAKKMSRRIAVVASSDLSHRLIPGAPAGYDPRGKEFDSLYRRLIEDADARGLLSIDPELVERAGQCGLRPTVMLFGALDGLRVKSQVLSYEGPFGVGYLVAELKPTGLDAGRSLIGELGFDGLLNDKNEAERENGAEKGKRGNAAASEDGNGKSSGTGGESGKSGESFLVRAARRSLESYVRGNWNPELGEDIPEDFRRRAGAFVSLKKDGNLRGCIGTIKPQRKSLVEEVIYNAVAAGVEDPRFFPVREDELDDLVYSVDVLGEPEPVESLDQLDPKQYGVIVKKGFRSGLLLPDIEGVDTVEEQLDIACRKAGIDPRENYKIERFRVIRYK